MKKLLICHNGQMRSHACPKSITISVGIQNRYCGTTVKGDSVAIHQLRQEVSDFIPHLSFYLIISD